LQSCKENIIFVIAIPTNDMRILAAPLQGYTTAAWRHYHAEIYGGTDAYLSPFIRVEKGEIRRHDFKSIFSDLNANQELIPQIIFRDVAEFRILVDAVKALGYSEVNLNMGCPFPPQVKHGRGAAVVANASLLQDIRNVMAEYADISFSVKMRLGVDDPQQWRGVADILNAMPLQHITLHPRIARQQYSGDLHMEQFEAFAAQSSHPVIFNGEISTPEDIAALAQRFPQLYGVMIGRGLLARPSLIQEYRDGQQWSAQQQLASVIKLHQSIYEHYRTIACGDAQFLSLIKPFWEYLEPLIGHKPAKMVKKATSVAKYHDAIAIITS
jgi:tRNA-dihydrouridine synthase